VPLDVRFRARRPNQNPKGCGTQRKCEQR
jgi:hypothetical protein